MAHFPRTQVIHGTQTLANVNAASGAGAIILDPQVGRNIRITDCWLRALGGNVGGATAIIVTDTAASPVTVVSATAGALTQNALKRSGASNVTVTNQGATLGTGQGLRLGRTVGDLTTATGGIEYCIECVFEPVNNVTT
jgi:hypothetical protein